MNTNRTPKQQKTKKIVLRILKYTTLLLIIFLVIELFRPTWTSKIPGADSISELRKIEVNGVELEVMIRGTNTANPVLLFVHGGPCCSEIPYITKYQDLLEETFTIVHYDQRGSGKSYQLGTDYSGITTATHVADLLTLTDYVTEYLGQDNVILIGHSYGTYIATQAAAQSPAYYSAYIGIGQMSDTIEIELDNLHACMQEAKDAGNTEDYNYLLNLEPQITNGELLAPRSYVRKYNRAARLINENADYYSGFLFGTEYNLLDGILLFHASGKYQEALLMEAINHPISKLVTSLELPVYFVMGKYDCMTSPDAAENYLNNLSGSGERQMVIFDESAHYPQLEEKEKFYQWMCDTFIK